MTLYNQGWSYNGQDLNRLVHNIRLLSPTEEVPARRGDNLVIPGRTGRTYVYKPHDQRIISLAMFVLANSDAYDSETGAGAPYDGYALSEVPGQVMVSTDTSTSANYLQTNLNRLQKLFGVRGQHDLVRMLPDGTELTISAEVRNTVQFQAASDKFYDFIVEFTCAYPYWDGPADESATGSISSSPTNVAITHSGTAETDDPTITIVGAITNPRVTIGDVWVQYTGTVSAGATLTINCDDYTADVDGSDVTSSITHSGDARWLVVPAGASTAVVTGTSLSGATINLTYRPRWF